MSGSLRLLLVLSGLLVCQAMIGRCAHDEKQPDFVPRYSVIRSSSSSHLSAFGRGSSWEPIRISVHYGPLNITEHMKAQLQGAIRGAVNWLQHTLRVQPVLDPFHFEPETCTSDNILVEFEEYWIYADYVLYVVSDMEDNGYAGFASACTIDEYTDQPVKGLFYFNAGAHLGLQDEQVFSTVVHEIMHALGFGRWFFRHFRKSPGQRYSLDELYVEETVRGYKVKKLATPTVRQKAREAFGCPDLNGVELEGGGGSGTIGSHWEKRVMNNDFMVADALIFDVIYSHISVAVFQDSGWYKVSYKYANPIQWGAGKGCEFISQKCIVDGNASFSEFCTKRQELGCDFLNLRKSRCRIKDLSTPIPPEFQYFGSPYVGNNDFYLDYCPIMLPYSDGDCRDPSTVWMEKEYGETPGLNSRCVNWFRVNTTEEFMPRCHVVDCNEAEPVITVGSMTLTCPIDGGPVQVDNWQILCPPREQLCRDVPCVNNCYGFGVCRKGFCQCDDGSEECNFWYEGSVIIAITTGPLILIW